jgi:hypothetical protein
VWPYSVSPRRPQPRRNPAVVASLDMVDLYEAIQPRLDPMLDFDERDLIKFAEAAGFKEVALQPNIAVGSPEPLPWQALVNIAGNPLIPTLGEAMQQALTPQEADRFTGHLRPLVEHGHGHRRIAASYLWATSRAVHCSVGSWANGSAQPAGTSGWSHSVKWRAITRSRTSLDGSVSAPAPSAHGNAAARRASKLCSPLPVPMAWTKSN